MLSTIKLIVFAEMFYCAAGVYGGLTIENIIDDYWKEIGILIKYSVFGHFAAGWFLYALLFCYLSLVIMRKVMHTPIIPFFVLMLLVLHIVSYNIISKDMKYDYYTSNFWLMGFPFFYLGFLINRYNYLLGKCDKKILLVIATLGVAESWIEVLAYGKKIYILVQY